MNIKKYSSLFLTIIVLFVLVPPYLLRWYDSSYEPYPAILLPRGAGKVRLDGNGYFIFTEKKFWAVKNNKWVQLNSGDLLENFSNILVLIIAGNNFGQNSQKRNKVKIKNKELSDHIRNRLREMNYNDRKFKVTKVLERFDPKSGKKIKSKIINEKTYTLY